MFLCTELKQRIKKKKKKAPVRNTYVIYLFTVDIRYLEYALSRTFRYLEQKSRSLQHLQSDAL